MWSSGGGIPSTNVVYEEHRSNSEDNANNRSNNTQQKRITVSLLLIKEGTVLTEEGLAGKLLTQHNANGPARPSTIAFGKHGPPWCLFLIRFDILHERNFTLQGLWIGGGMSPKLRKRFERLFMTTL
jgi:hypothetical protein